MPMEKSTQELVQEIIAEHALNEKDEYKNVLTLKKIAKLIPVVESNLKMTQKLYQLSRGYSSSDAQKKTASLKKEIEAYDKQRVLLTNTKLKIMLAKSLEYCRAYRVNILRAQEKIIDQSSSDYSLLSKVQMMLDDIEMDFPIYSNSYEHYQ